MAYSGYPSLGHSRECRGVSAAQSTLLGTQAGAHNPNCCTFWGCQVTIFHRNRVFDKNMHFFIPCLRALSHFRETPQTFLTKQNPTQVSEPAHIHEPSKKSEFI